MAESGLEVLLVRNAGQSAVINAAFSLAFFLLVFGWPAGPLQMGPPDQFAFDFLPQAAAVGLMSALVPVLVSRREVAQLSRQAPRRVRLIALRAAGYALGSLVPGAAMMVFALAGPWPPLAPGAALAIKLLFGAVLGAVVTTLAIRKNAS